MTKRPIRSLKLNEVRQVLDWAKAEGWNPGLDDAEPFRAADADGFFGCFIDGQLASAISAVRYGNDFGFIGLYICHPDFRGRGLGKRIWDHGMTWLNGRTIGLDGVPEQQANYARMGFRPHYKTIRWSGIAPVQPFSNGNIVAVDADVFSQLTELDRRAFPAKRSAFLQAWVSAPRLALAVISHGKLTGYGVLRACHEGFKVGPLFAETEAQAAELFLALCQSASGQNVHIDVPEGQEDFTKRLAALGFGQGFTTARMYRGVPPRLEGRLAFGVTTLELG